MWLRFILIIVVATIVTSLSDWLFSGLPFHNKAFATPEIWRPRASEGPAIAWSQLVGVFSSVAFLALLISTRSLTVSRVLVAAVLVWLAGPVVVIAQTVIWTKLHPVVGTSQSVAWLIRFVVTGLLGVAWIGRAGIGVTAFSR